MSDLNPYEEGLALELQAAQKRIEALIEQLDAARKDADEAEAYAWELEQRLGAALEPVPTDAARARVIRNGEHLFNTAKSLGWADDGEGALEFVMRRTREVALEDAAQAREAAQLDFVTLLTDAAAVAMKAREEALRDAAEVADEHTFGAPAVRDAILALIGEKPREQRE